MSEIGRRSLLCDVYHTLARDHLWDLTRQAMDSEIDERIPR